MRQEQRGQDGTDLKSKLDLLGYAALEARGQSNKQLKTQ